MFWLGMFYLLLILAFFVLLAYVLYQRLNEPEDFEHRDN